MSARLNSSIVERLLHLVLELWDERSCRTLTLSTLNASGSLRHRRHRSRCCTRKWRTSMAIQRQPRYGSDVIVDMLRACGIEYAACNPGASFRGLHDSIVNYGDNEKPEMIECCHEEISVALAHGYAKATGKPMAAIL